MEQMNKNSIKLLLSMTFSPLLLAFTSTGYSSPVNAASDAECGIWMCLPTGFGQGCSDSKKAFKKRIKRFKPALPSFSSCLSKTDSGSTTDNFDSKTGYAAQIGAYKECIKTRETGSNSNNSRTICVQWETHPETIIKDTTCRISHRDGERSRTPKHCTKTLRYTEVYRNGQRFGNTHYY
ncbi:hypothetical protein EDB44_11264 [Vibrio crassostreae]|uniref:hypothetical protein n=1 Tax=Vibrio crassostreae TaxID=246167 RepID=UPI0010DC9E89|nr:hypothetical protein [Vibrio crassostreae]TCT60443.1 hypothetical protein EDB44_11264 [Vibrio crassostreae]TCT82175.1 hypothetical protein EDB43_11264 [Vibrio crassostreae]